MSRVATTIRFARCACSARLACLVPTTLILTSLLVASGPGQAQAQLFGVRTLGRGANSPSSQTSQRQSGGPINLRSGRAAFQRPLSSGNDFVGRDQRERETFVGIAQGRVTQLGGDTSVGLRRSRSQDILSRRRPNANVLQIQRGTGARAAIYAPRLQVEFEHRPSTTARSDRQAAETIASIFATQGFPGVTISVEAGVATLRGKVASQDQQKVAAAIVNLESGVQSVDNQLQLQGDEVLKTPR